MNILLCTNGSSYTSTQIGGAETSIRLIGERLAEKGHNVVYITQTQEDVSETFNQQINGVKVYFYPKAKKRSIGRKLLGKNSKKFKEKDIKQLADQVCTKHRIDLVYIHYHLATLERFLALRAKHHYKIVMRMAGLSWYEYAKDNDSMKKRFERIFKDVDSINYNTPGLKSLTYQYAEKINFTYQPKDEFVADIGAFTKLDHIKPPRRENNGCMKIVVATRFSSYQKRQDILVEAIKLIGDDIDIKVTMIGSGPNRETIENKIKEYGLESKFEIIPFLTQKELWECLSTQDLLCHPCEYEGLSKIIIESMMLGLPVMASDVLPLRDYIEPNETGFLAPNDPQDWANAIRKLYSERETLSKISLSGKVHALKKYNCGNNISAYETNLKRVLTLS